MLRKSVLAGVVVMSAFSMMGFAANPAWIPLSNTTIAEVGRCNATALDVRLSGDGTILINGEPEDLRGLKVAAMRKDDACRSTPALVNYVFEGAAPNNLKNEVRYWLTHIVTNIALTEKLR